MSKWQQMIRDLQAAGFTYERIAIECQLAGVEYTRDAVKLLAQGRRAGPMYDPGAIIVRMHTKHCKITSASE